MPSFGFADAGEPQPDRDEEETKEEEPPILKGDWSERAVNPMADRPTDAPTVNSFFWRHRYFPHLHRNAIDFLNIPFR